MGWVMINVVALGRTLNGVLPSSLPANAVQHFDWSPPSVSLRPFRSATPAWTR